VTPGVQKKNHSPVRKESQEAITIGELAARVGLRTSALRYYQDQGLLQPLGRTEAGYRVYGPESEMTLRFIQRAQRLGFSLADIRTLLQGWQEGDLSDQAIIATAEQRFLALEQRVTQLLVQQHELELFLQDLRQRAAENEDGSSQTLLSRLIDKVCANPLIQPPGETLNMLLDAVECNLSSMEGQQILGRLTRQHVHIWQEEEGYNILVVSDDPKVEDALQALSELEADCQAHAHLQEAPEFMHDGEGFLLRVRGDSAFIYARLFLALQRGEVA
jgi:DNA-binding transcriptional MerR regulator